MILVTMYKRKLLNKQYCLLEDLWLQMNLQPTTLETFKEKSWIDITCREEPDLLKKEHKLYSCIIKRKVPY